MAAPTKPQRHQGLDGLRGVLIVAVIIGHFPTSGGHINPFGPVPEWLYFFHIPLFLALSCLFAKPFSATQLKARAWQILLPYALWVALTSPREFLGQPLRLLQDAAMGNYAHIPSILWFLPALFTSNLLVALWRRACDAGPGARIPLCAGLMLLSLATFLFAPRLALGHPRIPFGLDVALFLLPFFWVIDQVWRRRQWLADKLGGVLVPAALLALPLGGGLVRSFERVKTHSAYARRVDFAQFSVPETLAGYLGMTLMAGALLLLAGRLRWPRWLAAVGRASMPIFLLHYLLLFGLTRCIGWAGESRGWLLLYGLAVIGLIIALAMLAAQGVTRLSPRLAGWLGLKSVAPPVS